ncbi:MAG: ABC transporter ATP-binding protein [Candidatus Dormibacteraceae bacterium]
MLELEDVRTYRGQSYVLQGVSMRIPDSACTTLLGRNGMGKTTLIRSLMGLTPPRSGHIRLDGTELVGKEPFKIARMGLALVPQGRHIFSSLTVEENLLLAARRSPNGTAGDAWTLERLYDLFPNLKARRQNRGGQLSGGEQQMLAIGRALMTNPRIVLMDEPSEGLAPVIVQRVAEVINSLREQKLSILLVEQNYRLGVQSADHVYVLSKGVMVWEGSPADLDAATNVRESHLGV